MLAVAGIFLILVAFSSVRAQTLNARISVTSTSPARIRIDAHLPGATKTLSFRNTYAGVLGLGERIEKVAGIRDNGEAVSLQNPAPGEYLAAEQFTHFIYEVNLAGPSRPAQLSHVSSLTPDRGVLMMTDLLPQAIKDLGNFASAVIALDVPAGWTIASNLKAEGSRFSTDEPENAVFLIGPSLHEKRRQQLAAARFSIVTSGKWPFSDNDVTKVAGRILDEYSRVTQFELKRDALLMVVPYPGDAGPQSWSAETRGNAVVLLLGANSNRKRVLAQLGIVLSHELFHLWVPNSLKLQGDYDWFFEGFTLYQALRTDLRLGLISFDDFLDTIARVYDSYRSAPDRDRLSLIEASERRWTTSAALVYDKGMLVAFLYDLSLRKLTNCQASLDDVYAELFRLPETGQSSANETIIRILSRSEELKSLTRDYVENAVPIKLEPIISAYGIQSQAGRDGSGATKLTLDRKAGSSQRKLLACLR
jgi:predicted metalloprotease with PDZ domain